MLVGIHLYPATIPGMRLPVVGHEVRRRAGEYALVLDTEEGFGFRIEGAFSVDDDGRLVHFDPTTASWDTALAEYRFDRIGAAGVDDDAVLRVTFESGAVVVVPADPEHEAWTLFGPSGYLVVSLPGGELAVWAAR